MDIRTANLDDLDDLVLLFEGYRKFYEKNPDAIAAKVFLQERIENKESVIFMAYSASGEAVGFTQLYPLFSSTRMKRLWLLNDLFVKEAFRGQGFSKALIDRAKQLAHDSGACEIMLETAKTNDIGNQLYPAMGFELGTDFNWYHLDC
jgi:GNAT superfamily N-acetyltransferase